MNNLYYNNKKLKEIKKKRTQKTKKVWGTILTVAGALGIPAAMGALASGGDVSGLISSLLFLVPGLVLLLQARKQVRRWDRYEAIIDNRGNTPISLIAKKMGLSEKTVYSDLQTMIHNDFFIGPNYNIEAYIDAERDMLVMASGGQPLRPLPDLPEEEADAKAGSSFEKESPDAGDEDAKAKKEAEEIHEVELTDLELIQQAITDTPDDEVRGYLYGLEGSVRRIDERLQDEPELMQKVSIKRLYKFYLPQILDLIRQYQEPDTPPDLKRQIKEALKTSANALSNIEADLLERDQMDAEVNIEVLKNMFAQDGLLDRNGQGMPGQAQPQSQPQPQPHVQGR